MRKKAGVRYPREKEERENEPGTRSLPIHCIIEQTSGPPSFNDNTQSDEKSTHTNIELDSYAILPGTTLITECVQSALVKLGYNSTEALGAKGAIQIKNWKPLSFDNITDNKTANIDDLLGELTQVATLRIRISSPAKVTSAEEVKERLLQLLLNHSHGMLGTGYPDMEKNGISNGHPTLATISPEMRRAFDKWYEEQLKSYTDGNSSNGMSLATAAKELLAIQQQKISTAMALTQEVMATQEQKMKCLTPPAQLSPPVSRPTASSTPTEAFSHPAYQHYLPGKTRMRTSFDPEHEIPRLQRWFSDSQHPSREQMLHYLNELNSLESRKGRRPLDLTNIIYWFKNARAAHRRATKNNSDDSFEMEEENEKQTPPDGIPFLPNRNAVYMVPYPHYPNMSHHLGLLSGHNKLSGQINDREPCDLSINSRSRSPPEDDDKYKSLKYDSNESARQSPSASDEGEEREKTRPTILRKDIMDSPTRSDEGYSEMVEKSPSKGSSPEKDDVANDEALVKKELSELDERPTDLSMEKSDDTRVTPEMPRELINDEPNDLTMNKNSIKSEGKYESSHKMPNMIKRTYESDDDLDSDCDDDRSLDGSLSSHDESKISALRESYLNSARSMNFGGVGSSPSSQPLHIPQFPHPLAMHYFPLNTHFYSQQANQLKYHGHQQSSPQSTPKSSPGHGQENNSHRKRRTRVFIDPLSEIPKLEKWFLDDTHPSSYMIDKYCEELNNSEYRQKFPKLEPKNVQLWFKNHRAKVKRMRIGGLSDHMFA